MCHICTNSVIAILYFTQEKRGGRETESVCVWRWGGGGGRQRVREKDEESNTDKRIYRQLETDRGR